MMLFIISGKAEIAISVTKVLGKFQITLEQKNSSSYFAAPPILATGEIKVQEEVTPNIPEWKTKIGILQFDAYLKILKYSVPEDPCVGYVTKYLEGKLRVCCFEGIHRKKNLCESQTIF